MYGGKTAAIDAITTSGKVFDTEPMHYNFVKQSALSANATDDG